MKEGIHPEYKPVVFRDVSTGFEFLTNSTVKTNKTTVYSDGNEYGLYELEISSASHPFYTNKQQLVDSAGRIERFNRKYKTTFQKDSDSSSKVS